VSLSVEILLHFCARLHYTTLDDDKSHRCHFLESYSTQLKVAQSLKFHHNNVIFVFI